MCIFLIITINVAHINHISTYYRKSNLFGLLKMYQKNYNKTINIAYNILNKVIYNKYDNVVVYKILEFLQFI